VDAEPYPPKTGSEGGSGGNEQEKPVVVEETSPPQNPQLSGIEQKGGGMKDQNMDEAADKNSGGSPPANPVLQSLEPSQVLFYKCFIYFIL
jgi:hypothetical protein